MNYSTMNYCTMILDGHLHSPVKKHHICHFIGRPTYFTTNVTCILVVCRRDSTLLWESSCAMVTSWHCSCSLVTMVQNSLLQTHYHLVIREGIRLRAALQVPDYFCLFYLIDVQQITIYIFDILSTFQLGCEY